VPTYDYQCRSCGSVTEVIHSMLEEGPSVCERCGGVLRRVLFPAGIIFKGSGFYRNDSRNGSSAGSGSGSSKGTDADKGSSASDSSAKAPSTPTETKGPTANEAPTG
jgi:putative FmdB family regulatory protein